MKSSCRRRIAWTLFATPVVCLAILIARPYASADSTQNASKIPLIAPPKPLGTGLLLQEPLPLDWYTREMFESDSKSIGEDRIEKPWTSPITTLPNHDQKNVQGLKIDEVFRYMELARNYFDEGKAIPMSDVGLISTQEDVIRRPMLNHISVFENDVARVYLLVQKTHESPDWAYFSIVQDMTVSPPIDYYAYLSESGPELEGHECYKCHSSGPLAIHPAREDLVLDARLAAEVSNIIANQPTSRFYFPDHDPAKEYGKAIEASACIGCHSEDGDRSPLYKVHAHPMRILAEFGYMPPDRRLNPDEIKELLESLK
jgi:hypothetical protein